MGEKKKWSDSLTVLEVWPIEYALEKFKVKWSCIVMF